MSIAAISKRSAADVYRLRDDIDPALPLVPVNRNEARELIEDFISEIPAAMLARWESVIAHEVRDLDRLAEWAPRFIDAYYAGDPLPLLTPTKKVTHVARGDWATMTTREAALQAVLDNRGRGVTAAEARTHTGIAGSGIGGALSLLDQAGVLARVRGERRAHVGLTAARW